MKPTSSKPTTSHPPIPRLVYFTITGAAIKLTMFTTLIIGFSAGPAVSFNGSPTVSPTTPALWRSEPFPVLSARSRGSSSIVFLALSQAPPAFDINTASICPDRMTPARKPPNASTPKTRPTMMGVTMDIVARGSSSFCAERVEIPTTCA